MAAYASLVSLMHIIDNLENHPRPPISLHKNQAFLLTQKIIFLQRFLEAYNPHLPYSSEADPLESRIVDAAHAVEDVIESHIVDQIIGPETMNLDMLFADHHHDVAEEDHTHVDQTITSDGEKFISTDALEKLIEEIALIEKEAMEIEQTVAFQGQVQHHLLAKSMPPVSSLSSSSSSSISLQSKMVGADELLLEMKDKLCSDHLALQIIPIIGMGGSGKTTLARNIYQDPLIKEHFYIRAWVTISQEFSIRKILVQLLEQLDKVASQDSSEGELGDMLHKHLFGRRYLIILDDMWNIGAWEGVKMFLPNNINGSRIVVTTRLSNLASQLTNSHMLRVKLLDEADSWDLLSKIVFGEKGCTLELEEIGKKISKGCKGLPLSIVVVGGLLSKSERTVEFWIHIEENLSSLVNLENDEHCLKTLHLSYKQLPVYLKPCFLCMGVYFEDEKIRTSKLIKLWVAEGFIKPVKGKSLEETAKEYLDDLNSRNLILIHKVGSIGNMKYCKMHDLLRDLSLREAQKERFYRLNTSTAQGINGQRRIVISSWEAVNALPYSMPLARSFICDLYEELPPLSLRLLRILQSRASLGYKSELLHSIHQLVNSRFLDFYVNHEWRIPDSILLFWNLQTFIFRGYGGEFRELSEIWYMPHIRHVQASRLQLPDPPKDAIMVLRSLQTLGTITDFRLSVQVVKIIPNIKKLRLCYHCEPDEEGCCLNNFVCLDKLESLIIKLDYYSELIDFPCSLKKLSLVSPVFEDMLDKIGELPLLQKLVLYFVKFKEGYWKTSEGQFRSLKYLRIVECMNIKTWTSESSHFPCLEHLVLSGQPYLEEIPLDFANIATLSKIQLDDCPYSVVVSAKRIVEEREDIYGEEENLQVKVKISKKNEALHSLATPRFRITTCYPD